MTVQEPVIVIDNLHKSYGKVQAVKGISMRVEQGEIFGFLGPNGAGKTTTIRCMLDVIRPTSGTLRVLGLDAQRDKMELHQRIGYLPGDVRLPGELKRQLKGYSKGMRQKIGVVLAFMCDPDVLILDEPTSGLDPLLQRTFNEFLLQEQARGKTIFMSSHIMSDVEKVCQRVAVIRKGEIVTIEEVEKLRQKAGQRVTVEFGDAVSPDDLSRIPGVSMVTSHNHAYHFNVGGSMDALIKALSRHEVLRLQAEEAPLEEVFLKFYENPQVETTTTGTR